MLNILEDVVECLFELVIGVDRLRRIGMQNARQNRYTEPDSGDCDREVVEQSEQKTDKSKADSR